MKDVMLSKKHPKTNNNNNNPKHNLVNNMTDSSMLTLWCLMSTIMPSILINMHIFQ